MHPPKITKCLLKTLQNPPKIQKSPKFYSNPPKPAKKPTQNPTNQPPKDNFESRLEHPRPDGEQDDEGTSNVLHLQPHRKSPQLLHQRHGRKLDALVICTDLLFIIYFIQLISASLHFV